MNKETKNCYTCGNCMYVLEGDYICEVEIQEGATLKPVMEEHSPADRFMWCGGKH